MKIHTLLLFLLIYLNPHAKAADSSSDEYEDEEIVELSQEEIRGQPAAAVEKYKKAKGEGKDSIAVLEDFFISVSSPEPLKNFAPDLEGIEYLMAVLKTHFPPM